MIREHVPLKLAKELSAPTTHGRHLWSTMSSQQNPTVIFDRDYNKPRLQIWSSNPWNAPDTLEVCLFSHVTEEEPG